MGRLRPAQKASQAPPRPCMNRSPTRRPKKTTPATEQSADAEQPRRRGRPAKSERAMTDPRIQSSLCGRLLRPAPLHKVQKSTMTLGLRRLQRLCMIAGSTPVCLAC